MTEPACEVLDLALYRARLEATAPFEGAPLDRHVRAALDEAVLDALRGFVPDSTIEDAVAMTNQVLGECTPEDPAPKLPWR
jgi:hypothetical protein